MSDAMKKYIIQLESRLTSCGNQIADMNLTMLEYERKIDAIKDKVIFAPSYFSVTQFADDLKIILGEEV